MTHPELVKKLFRRGRDILIDIRPQHLDLLHAASGISGESGEILDMVKKYVFFNMPFDREKIIKEMGDLEFYLGALRLVMNLSREEILEKNIEKLMKRYPDGYSDAAAAARVDVIKI